MAFKKANGDMVTPLSLVNAKKPFEGYYMASRVVESEKLEGGRAIIHEFMTEEGEIVAIWGMGQLTHNLKEVFEKAPGARTRITYLNKGTFKKGKKTLPVHNFTVEYDPEDTRTSN